LKNHLPVKKKNKKNKNLLVNTTKITNIQVSKKKARKKVKCSYMHYNKYLY